MLDGEAVDDPLVLVDSGQSCVAFAFELDPDAGEFGGLVVGVDLGGGFGADPVADGDLEGVGGFGFGVPTRSMGRVCPSQSRTLARGRQPLPLVVRW